MEIFKKTWKRMTAFSLALILAMTAPQVPSGKVFATEKTQKQTEQKNELTTAESIAVKEEKVDEIQGMETGEAIRYLERWWDDAGSVLKIGTGAVSEYTEVTEELYTWEDGWYVVKSDVTLEQLVTVSGSVHLILMDDATLTAKRGIRVSAGNSLNIYGQSDADNMGKLVVTCGDNDNNEEGQAGIGGGKNQGSKNGIEKENNRVSSEEQVIIPGREVGKIFDIFNGEGLTASNKSKSSVHGMEQTIEIAKSDFEGLCFTNLVDFDALWGHRRNVAGYAKEIEQFDAKLGEFLPLLKEDDLVILTADHGNDPTYTGTDHTREKVPFLAWSPSMSEGGLIPEQETFAVVGATVAENFGVEMPEGCIGTSVLKEL